MNRARLAYDHKNFPLAAAEFERGLTACPQPEPILLGLAQSRLMLQNFSGAIESLDRLLALEPKSLQALKLKADALYLAGNEPAAEKALQDALSIDSGFESAHYALGRMYYQQSRYAEAIEHFEKVLAADANSYRAHDNIALCYEALNLDSKALTHYFKALDLVHKEHPEYDWVYGNIANFFLRRDENEKAFQMAAEAAARNPNSARNFFLTGKALFKLGKAEQSVKWLKRAIELDDAYPEPRYLLGQIYRRQGMNNEAEREMNLFRELSGKPRPRR